MSDLTVVMMNYKRTHRVQEICDILKDQGKVRIAIWDNSNTGKMWRAEDVYETTRNQPGWPRWFIAAHVKTPYVVILDDDIAPHPGFLSAATRAAEISLAGQCLVGIEGVKLVRGKSYADSQHIKFPLKALTPVDIVKGCCVVAQRDLLRKLPFRPEVRDEEFLAKADDIIASYLLRPRGGGSHLIDPNLAGYCHEFPESEGPEALSKARGWYEFRELARREVFG